MQKTDFDSIELNPADIKGRDDSEGIRKMLFAKSMMGLETAAAEGKMPERDGLRRLFATDMSRHAALVADTQYMTADYMRLGGENIKKFSDLAQIADTKYSCLPAERAATARLMITALSGAEKGDEFSKGFLVKVYKTYFRDEYNVLKRFKKLNAGAAFEIAGDERVLSLARVAVMAETMDIEIDPDMAPMYESMNAVFRSKPESPKEAEADPEDIERHKKEILEKAGKDRKMCRQARAVKRAIESILDMYGLPDDYPELFPGYLTPDMKTAAEDMAEILTALRRKRPSQECDLDTLETLLYVYRLLRALIMTSDQSDRLFEAAFNGTAEDGPFADTSLWKGVEAPPEKTREPHGQETEAAESAGEDADASPEEDAAALLEGARRELAMEKQNNKALMGEASGLRREIESKDEELERLRKMLPELKQLRDFAYESADKGRGPECVPEKLEIMEADIAQRNIVIIGGRTGWRNQLKNKYRGWKVYRAEGDMAMNKQSLISADMIFFYTDCLSHINYTKAIGIIRDNGLKFGYIGSSNYANTVAQIYAAVKREGL